MMLRSPAARAAYWHAHPDTQAAYVFCCWQERWHHLYAPGMQRQNVWRYEALGVDVLRLRRWLPAEGVEWSVGRLEVELGETWTRLCTRKPCSTFQGHTCFLLRGELGLSEALRAAGKVFGELAKTLGLR